MNLKRVLVRSRAIGINWNAEKCVISTTKVRYSGYALSDKGVQPDPKTTAAIQNTCLGLCKELCF